MITTKLLSLILNTHVTKVYQRDDQWRFSATKTKDGWESSADVPLPKPEDLQTMCKTFMWNTYAIMLESAHTDTPFCSIHNTNDICHFADDRILAETEALAVIEASELVVR
jgi:hypothetical protein